VNREKEKVSTTKDIANLFPIIFDVFTFYVCTRSLKTLNVYARVIRYNLSIYLHIFPCVQDC